MSDVIDKANEQVELTLRALLSNRVKPVDPTGTGFCIYCGDVVEPTITKNQIITGRWCDNQCRDSWSREND